MPDKRRPLKPEAVARLPVSISVILAEKMFSLDQILELKPGAILDFERSHEGPLDFCVGGSRVGNGRAIDVGDSRLAFRVDEVDVGVVQGSGGPVS